MLRRCAQAIERGHPTITHNWFTRGRERLAIRIAVFECRLPHYTALFYLDLGGHVESNALTSPQLADGNTRLASISKLAKRLQMKFCVFALRYN